ncbi:MAG: MarR family winged helix-turn-helix transcriptional regulator [Chloroflexota bacterium]
MIDDDQPVVIPALLRAARRSYGRAVAAELSEAGFDDMPQNGPFVLGGMANHGGTAAEMIDGLGITKQAASQLIDTLVVRDYLTREIDPEDRRRIVINLTARGKSAAQAVRAGVELVDDQLAQMISPEELAGLRVGLFALDEIAHQFQQ